MSTRDPLYLLPALYVVVFIDFLQLSFIFPLCPKIVESFGGGALEIGALGSAAAVSEALAAPLWEELSTRTGRRPIFLVAMLGCIVSTLAMAFANNFWVLVGCRVISGFCGGTAGVAGACVADATTTKDGAVNEEARYRNITKFQVALFSGLSIGPVVGGYLDQRLGWRVTAYISSVICVLNLLLLLCTVSESHHPEEALRQAPCREALRAVLRATPESQQGKLPGGVWAVCAAILLSSIGFIAFEVVGLLFVQGQFFEDDVNTATMYWSRVIAGVGVMALVTNVCLYEMVVKLVGLKGSMVCSSLLSALAFVMLSLPYNQLWFFTWCMVLCLAENVFGTSGGVMASCLVPPEQYGRAIGMLTRFGNAARLLGPFAMAPLYTYVDVMLPWRVNTGLKLMAMLLLVPVAFTPVPLSSSTSESQQSEAVVAVDRVQKSLIRVGSDSLRTYSGTAVLRAIPRQVSGSQSSPAGFAGTSLQVHEDLTQRFADSTLPAHVGAMPAAVRSPVIR